VAQNRRVGIFGSLPVESYGFGVTDCDHVLSKRIVQSVSPGTTIVLENLTDRYSQTYSPAQPKASAAQDAVLVVRPSKVRGFIQYKAQERGLKVVAVDPPAPYVPNVQQVPKSVPFQP
jgi:IS605 OrfB family transposase